MKKKNQTHFSSLKDETINIFRMQNKLNKWRTGSKLNQDNRSSSVTYNNRDASTTFSNSKKQTKKVATHNRSAYGINSNENLHNIEMIDNQIRNIEDNKPLY